MSIAVDSDVTIDDVRLALDDIDASALADEVVESAISDEEVIVGAMLPDDWEDHPDDYPEELVAKYIKFRAAHRSFHSSPVEVRKQALDAAVSYDIQSFRGRLTTNVQEIEDLLFPDLDGNTAAFVDVTAHAGSADRLADATRYTNAFR